MTNLQVEGNANYVEPISKVNTRGEDSIKLHSFMQDFINDDNETPKLWWLQGRVVCFLCHITIFL